MVLLWEFIGIITKNSSRVDNGWSIGIIQELVDDLLQYGALQPVVAHTLKFMSAYWETGKVELLKFGEGFKMLIPSQVYLF